MKKITISNSLIEVWGWKDTVYEETKGLDMHKTVMHINKDVDTSLKNMGYLLTNGRLVKKKCKCKS